MKLAGTWLVTEDWLTEFVLATMASHEASDTSTVPVMASVAPPAPRLTPARRRAAEQAQRELTRLGMGA